MYPLTQLQEGLSTHSAFLFFEQRLGDLLGDLAFLGDFLDTRTPRHIEGIILPFLPACFLTQAQPTALPQALAFKARHLEGDLAFLGDLALLGDLAFLGDLLLLPLLRQEAGISLPLKV